MKENKRKKSGISPPKKYLKKTFHREEKITPAKRGILFPPQKTKNSFSGGHQKIPCQQRGFPVSERFGKKIQEFCKKFLQCTL
jgi:hypothetical protein